MKIEPTDLKFYSTVAGLGGAITATEVSNGQLHNIFGKVEAADALAGSTQYQCIYFKNEHSTLTLFEAVTYLTSNTPSEDTNLFIALGSSGVGGTEQSIVDINTAPAGVTFTDTLNDVLIAGDVPAGSYFPLWLQRVIDPATEAFASDGVAVTFQGKTEASL